MILEIDNHEFFKFKKIREVKIFNKSYTKVVVLENMNVYIKNNNFTIENDDFLFNVNGFSNPVEFKFSVENILQDEIRTFYPNNPLLEKLDDGLTYVFKNKEFNNLSIEDIEEHEDKIKKLEDKIKKLEDKIKKLEDEILYQ